MVKGLPSTWQTQVWPLGWKIPWIRKRQPMPVFLTGEFHGPRSLVGYGPWGHKESDMTERLTLPFSHFINKGWQRLSYFPFLWNDSFQSYSLRLPRSLHPDHSWASQERRSLWRAATLLVVDPRGFCSWHLVTGTNQSHVQILRNITKINHFSAQHENAEKYKNNLT